MGESKLSSSFYSSYTIEPKSEPTAELAPCSYLFCLFGWDRAAGPCSSPRDSKGFCGQYLLWKSHLASIVLQPWHSQRGQRLVTTNWPLATVLICGCGANKNVPTFLANLLTLFVQISAGH